MNKTRIAVAGAGYTGQGQRRHLGGKIVAVQAFESHATRGFAVAATAKSGITIEVHNA